MSINSGIFTILLQAGVLSAEDVEAIRAAMLKDETSVVSTVTAIRPD
ncbi:MAG: Type pilus assembly ATPase PilB, partial [Pseudomonadota bacterium]|nr:Type pilus assembly ATPase PilB [Pseudomonadota bacterium]